MASNYDNLPLDVSDAETKLMVDAAVQWIRENTTVKIDPDEELPSNAKLFVVKFCDMLSVSGGVASESLGGMSQSFSVSGGTGFLLADLASQLFGADYKGRNRFVSAKSRWK